MADTILAAAAREHQQPVIGAQFQPVIDLVGQTEKRACLFGRRPLVVAARLQDAEPFGPQAGAPALAQGLGVLQALAQPQFHPVSAIEKAFLKPGARLEAAHDEGDLLMRANLGLPAGLEHRRPAADAHPPGDVLFDLHAQGLLFIAAGLFAPAMRGIEGQPGVVIELAGKDNVVPQLHVLIRGARFGWLPSGKAGGKQQQASRGGLSHAAAFSRRALRPPQESEKRACMKFFVDTAEIEAIRDLAATGLLDGVTTNPSLIAKSGRDFKEVTAEICRIVDGPVSAEVVALDHATMMKEAEVLRKIADNVCIKVPLTVDGLKTCKALTGDGTMVNVTLCFSANQALLAAKAGATFVSPFVGRHDDNGFDGMELIRDIRLIYDNYAFATEILVASVRHTNHVLEAARIGADVMTAPPAVIHALFRHVLTDKGIEGFLADWARTGQSIL